MSETDDVRPVEPAPEHDPEASHATVGVHVNPFLRAYALCRDGFVVAVRTALHREPHPFGDVELSVPGMTQDPKREHVTDVTGAVVQPGMIVDNKGNVAPAGTMDRALLLDEPAYHDRYAVAPVPVTEQAELVNRPGNDGAKETPPVSHTDARIEGRDEDDKAVLPEGHENDHGVQEHHEHSVHDEDA